MGILELVGLQSLPYRALNQADFCREGTMRMLEVSHFTKYYGRTVACDDLSFCLPEGSVTVLLGPNGAGKSTLKLN